MSKHSEIHDSLARSLALARAPVAVSLADALPEGVPLWQGAPPAGCRFWQEGASRLFATEAKQHGLCSIGVYTHNLAMSPAVETDLSDALRVMADLTYVRPEDVARIPVLASRPRYIIYGPLAETPVEPGVVLLFVEAAQTLILSEAAEQLEGGAPPAMGRPACAVVPQASNSGRAALSLGCCGARAYLDVMTPETALFAIPGDRLEEFAARVEALAAANSILSRFHTLRRAAVEAGRTPTIRESLAELQA